MTLPNALTYEPALAMWTPGGWEIAAVLVLGLLLFGRRLPEVGRSLGRSIVEFKRGVKGIQDEIDDEIDRKPAAAKPAEPPAIADDARRVSQGERMQTPTATPTAGEPS